MTSRPAARRRAITRVADGRGRRPAPRRHDNTPAEDSFAFRSEKLLRLAEQEVADALAQTAPRRAPSRDRRVRESSAEPQHPASAYDPDYAAVGYAKRIADDFGIAVLLVHHVRKATSDDFLAEVSGTNGIAGAADAVLVLKCSRGEADGALHVTGRDVDEAEYSLTFDADLGLWNALPGPAIDHLVGETRSRILAHLRTYPKHTPKQIADGTGLSYELVKKTCMRMADDQQVYTDGRGQYSAVPAVPAVPAAGQTAIQGVPEGVPDGVPVPDRVIELHRGRPA